MLTFCPITGLPTIGFRSTTSQLVGTQPDGTFPDLLENQKAQLRLTCDCGVCATHQVHCSILIKGNQPYPSANRLELVVCPSCGQEHRLIRPLVLHDMPRERVVLRLPASYRTRSHAVLQWWFEILGYSSRPLIPAYASQPQLEFLGGEPGANQKPETGSGVGAKRKTLHAQAIKADSPRPLTPSPSSASKSSLPDASELPLPTSRGTSPPPTRPPKSISTSPPPTRAPQASSLNNINPVAPPMPRRTAPMLKPHKQTTPKPIPPASSSHDVLKPPAPLTSTEERKLTPPSPAPSRTPKPPTPFSKSTQDLGPPSKPTLPDLIDDDDDAPTIMGPAYGQGANADTSTVSKPSPRRHTASLGTNSFSASLESPSSKSGPLKLTAEFGASDEAGTIERPALDSMMPPPSASSTKADDILSKFIAEPVLDDPFSSLPLNPNPNPSQTTQMESPDILEEVIDDDDEDSIQEISDEDIEEIIPDIPTVSRPAPNALALLRQEQQQREPTAVRKAVGDGVSATPLESNPQPPKTDLSKWKKSKQSFWFETQLAEQKCHAYFLFPAESARILEQGGGIAFHIQLHRLPNYPLLALLVIFHNAEGETQYVLQCPMNIDDTETLIFLDVLMQSFFLQIHLCDKNYNVYQELHVQQPLEKNVEYLLNEARTWKDTIKGALDFDKARKQFEDPEYDRLGKMSHNFTEASFINIESPSMARLASGIVSYWSEAEQYDYLLSIKSFPVPYFKDIQERVIRACLQFGILLPDLLLEKARQMGLGESKDELLRKTLSSFAELNLHIRQPNDLDPWDNLENWQKLFEACDTHGIEVDEDIEELAELAERRCHEDSEIPVESMEELEIFEDFEDMEPQDLLELLHDTEYRLEAVSALVAKAKSTGNSYVEQVAAIFPQLSRDETAGYTESFIQFGPEAEDYLISWLPLPRAYQREAAMLALGKMRSEKAIDAIIKRLRSGEEWETAAEALSLIGDPVISHLSREIKNKNWLIRLRAVKALHKLSSPKAHKLIEQLTRDPNEVVKAEVAKILQH